MSSPPGGDATFIWATRGRTWGFRFLRRGGLQDPLAVYEEVFSKVGDQQELMRRFGGKVALRFADPEGRKDASGRVIPHDFVLLGPSAERVDSLEDGRELVWRQVADEYESVWLEPQPPSTQK